MSSLKYRRILLKLSGESFCRPGGFGLDSGELVDIARQICRAANLGTQVAVVVGGGNFLRGSAVSREGCIARATADYMGMLATVMNACALQDALETEGMDTRVQSALPVPEMCEPFIRRRCIAHLDKGKVVVLAAGTGAPFFTTDTAAAQRAIEIGAQVLLKATKVDGVYDKDPRQHPDARRIDRISYLDVLNRGLQVMDSTAVSLCMENDLPIVVFNFQTDGNIAAAVRGEAIGTVIGQDAI